MSFIKKNKAIKLAVFIILGIFCVYSNFTQAAAPDAPSDISLSTSCLEENQYILVTWEHVFGQNVEKYQIYRDSDPPILLDDSYIKDLPEGSFMSWIDYSVASGNSYAYYIRAMNNNSELSANSASKIKTTPYCPVPTLSLSTDCYGLSSQILLNWTLPSNINYIDLYRSNNFCVANTGTSCVVNDDCPAGDSCFSWVNQFPNYYSYWLNRNLYNSINYTYYIKVSGDGWSSESDKVSITTLDCVESVNPSPPPELTVTPICTGEVGSQIKTMVLDWTRSENIHKYIIYKDSIEEGSHIKDNIPQSDSPFYNDSGDIGVLGEITKNTVYTYRIEAFNDHPSSLPAYSTSTTVIFTEECSGQPAPGNSVNLLSESRCNGVDPVMWIGWDAPVTGGNVNNYFIYRNVNNGVFNYYTSVSNTFYNDENVNKGEAAGYHKYKIEARGIGGSSPEPFPEVSSQEVINCSSAVTPTIDNIQVHCSMGEDPFVRIEWSQLGLVDPNTHYFNIYRKLEEGELGIIWTTVNNNVNLWDDNNVVSNIPGNNYSYNIEAVGFGAGDSMAVLESVSVGWCNSTIPTISSINKSCDGSGSSLIDISWTASKNLDYYEVWRDGVKLSYSGTNIFYQDTITGAINNYFYEVKAIGKNGTEVVSAQSITTDNCAVLVAAPNIDAVNSISSCESFYYPYFNLVWDQVSNAEYYQVYRQKDEIGEVEELIYTSLDGTIVSYDDSPINNASILRVESSVNYFYRVVAIKSGVSSASSAAVLFSIDWCPPSAPFNLDNTQSCSGAQPIIDITWDKPLNIVSYEIYRKNDNSAIILSDVPVGASIAELYSDNSATEGTTYYYTIRAIGEDGSNTADSVHFEVAVGYCSTPNQPVISHISSECALSLPYVDLIWGNVNNVEYYELHRIFNTNDEIIAGCDILSCEDNGVNSGSTYIYYVLACNTGGCSARVVGLDPIGNDREIEVAWCPPDEIILGGYPYCDGLGNSIVRLTWLEDTIGNVDHYELSRNGGGAGQVVLSNALLANIDFYLNDQVSIFPPENSTFYTYTLKIVGKNGIEIEYSINLTTYNCTLPGIPTIDAVVSTFQCDGFEPYVYLDWADSVNATADGYLVLRDGIRVDLPEDIVGLWHFNENSGTTAYDETMNNNDGNLVNMDNSNWVQSPSGGGNDYSLEFNGSNEYINIPDNNTGLDINGNFTFEAWIYPYAFSTYNTILAKETTYLWSLNNGRLVWAIRNSNPGWTWRFTDIYPAVNTWTHIAITYDQSSVKAYENGVQVGSPIVASGPIITNNNVLTIGRRWASNYFNGIIGEVKIVSRALTQAEILDDYQKREASLYQGTSYDDYGIVSDNIYNYEIVARNIGGTSSDILNNIYVDWCPPVAPSSLQVFKDCDGLGNSEVTLTWDADLSNAVNNYQIIRINGGTTVLENNLIGTSDSYIDSSPPDNSTTYTYHIAAVGKEGSSATSTIIITTNDCSLLGANPNISISTPSCDNSIPYGYLEWNSVPNADYYEIYRDASEIATTTDDFYSDYDIINPATGVYLGNSFNYYIKACNFGGCIQGIGGNVIFNDPNSACGPFTPVLIESEARCESDGFGGIDAFADLKWYDLFPDSVNNYEVLIGGNSTSTTAENYNSSDKKEYIDFEKILDESLEGGTYSFILKLVAKNPAFSPIDSSQISLGVPECDAPAKPILDEPIPSCNEDQPQISLNWEDDSNTNDYMVLSAEDIGGVPGAWQTIEPSLVQSEYIHSSDNAFFGIEVDKKYHYAVMAFGDSGSYNVSDTVSTTTPLICYNSPLKPVISSIISNCDNGSPREPYIEIKWDRQPEENNTDYYEIWRNDQAERLNNADILDNKVSFSSYDYIGVDSQGVDSTVITDTPYQYYLVAIGQGGETQSEISAIITAPNCDAVPEKPENFSVVADCYGYCDSGTNSGEACNNNTDCDSNDCVISFIDGASIVLNWDRTDNTFQYMIYEDCGDGYAHHSTIDEIGYDNYDPNNSDIIYTTSSAVYIIHLSEEYIEKDCFYQVKARGWGGCSPLTDLIKDTVKICGNTPMAAQNLILTLAESDTIHIAWDDMTGIGEIGTVPINSPTTDETGGEFYFQVLRGEGDFISCKDGSFDNTKCPLLLNKYYPINSTLDSGETNDLFNFDDHYGHCYGTPYTICSTDQDCVGEGDLCKKIYEEGCFCYKIKSWNPAGETYSDSIDVITPKAAPGDFVLSKNLLSCEKLEILWTKSLNYQDMENSIGYNVYRTDDKTKLCCDEWELRNNIVIDACYGDASPLGGGDYDIKCDYDIDGDVDDDDFLYCIPSWLSTTCLLPECDVNMDMLCSVTDMMLFHGYYYPAKDVNPNCDQDCSDGTCYSTTTKIYHFTDYYDSDNLDEPFPSGKKYYYIIQALPMAPIVDITSSNQLGVQPCPSLPEWREVGF